MRPHCPIAAWLLMLSGLLPLSAPAQDFGDDLHIDASRLPTGLDSLAVFLIRDGDTVRTGTVWDEVRILETVDGAQVQRVYRFADQVMGMRLDTITDVYPSLSPLSLRSRSSRGGAHLDYAEARVEGWVVLADGDSLPVSAAMHERVYSSSSFDLILRAAPLAAGWGARIPAFLPSTRTVVPLRARATGSELVGGRRCWRVDADFAGSAVTFWIAEEARSLCRQVMQIGPGVQIMFGPFREQPVERRTA